MQQKKSEDKQIWGIDVKTWISIYTGNISSKKEKEKKRSWTINLKEEIIETKYGKVVKGFDIKQANSTRQQQKARQDSDCIFLS